MPDVILWCTKIYRHLVFNRVRMISAIISVHVIYSSGIYIQSCLLWYTQYTSKISWKKGIWVQRFLKLKTTSCLFLNQSFKSNDKHRYSNAIYILGECFHGDILKCQGEVIKLYKHSLSFTLNKSCDHIKKKNYLVKNYIENHITYILCKGFMQQARQRNILFMSRLRINSRWGSLLKKQPVDKNMVKDILK